MTDLSHLTVDRYLALDHDQRVEFYHRLPPDLQAWLERFVAGRTAMGWRADPMAMAVHLTRDSDTPIEPWRHSVVLARAFAAGIRAKIRGEVTEHRRQQWKVPQQHGKTTGARWGILWGLDVDPRLRFLYIGYAAEKVDEEAGEMLDLAKRYESVLNFRLRPDRQQKGAWKTEQGGGVYAAGITGGVAGWPGDAVVMDDLIKGVEAASSAATRARALRIYRGEIRMRLQSEADPIYDLGTRVHEDDVTGELDREEAKGGEVWHRIIMPAFCTDPANDPLGREFGEVLCPERYPVSEYEDRRRVAGSFIWSAVGQQNPTPEEGEEIKRGWFKMERRFPEHGDFWCASWDMKLTDRQVGDDAVGQVWARIGGHYWCVDQLSGVWGSHIVRPAIALMQIRWPEIVAHYIENTGKGPDLIPILRDGQPDYVLDPSVGDELGMSDEEREQVQAVMRRGVAGIVPVNPKGDKRARARAVVPMIEGGTVHLMDEPWAKDLVNQAVMLGRSGVHDDMLDAMTQALSRLRGGGGGVVKPSSGPLTTGGPAPVRPDRQRVSSPVAGVHRPTRRLG